MQELERWGALIVEMVAIIKDLNKLSRIVSHALRHEPWLYELELDEEGWVDTSALLAALRQESPPWSELTEQDLAEMIRVGAKQRHELAEGRIRALYGHSVPRKWHKVQSEPPPRLFHGTAPASVSKIRQEGLLPMARQYVHLSIDRATATAVGRRKATELLCLNPAEVRRPFGSAIASQRLHASG